MFAEIQPYMHTIIAGVSSIVSFGLGYYVGQRHVSGVKIDLSNAKRELTNLKNRFNAEKVS